ncbi:uncharacterized protein RJT20DRAFT_57263 [Scheffersomyces xylosifermentans]|uniref:uncharacterized protein n=1 Tax=Scheffersomyces xylosifermentans TaxID=1304137 RepID=UPI00315D8803
MLVKKNIVSLHIVHKKSLVMLLLRLLTYINTATAIYVGITFFDSSWVSGVAKYGQSCNLSDNQVAFIEFNSELVLNEKFLKCNEYYCFNGNDSDLQLEVYGTEQIGHSGKRARISIGGREGDASLVDIFKVINTKAPRKYSNELNYYNALYWYEGREEFLEDHLAFMDYHQRNDGPDYLV